MNKHTVLSSFEFDFMKYRNAASNNDLAALKKWTAYADIDSRFEALERAALKGHLECVKFLVDYVDPKMHQSVALVTAVSGYKDHHNRECFDFLHPLCDLNDALKKWNDIYGNEDNILLDEQYAWEQKQRIDEQLPSGNTSSSKKKI